MRDPYEVLGIQRDASEADIKKAFRKLAKQHHPDQNPNDKKAKERFAELSSSYDLLSDKDKRGKFDRGEVDAEGKPRYQGFEGFGGGAGGGGFDAGAFRPGGFRRGRTPQAEETVDPADVFADLFGGFGRGNPRRGPSPNGGGGSSGGGAGGPARGEDINAEVTVPFLEWARGDKHRVSLPNGRELEVKIPAGIEEGKTIRLRGQGKASPFGGEPGDALLSVKVAEHPRLRADGADLRVDLPLTLYEAVLGAKVPVPTLEGSVDLTVPPRSTGGRTMRLRGKGIKTATATGDMLVSLRVVLPEQVPASLQEAAEWVRDNAPYDPRA